MALDPITDRLQARRLLERAVAADTVPVLTATEVDDLMAQAASVNDTGATVYTGAGLNQAAATGWTWKAGKVSSDFTVTLKDGVKFNREQVYAHCLKMASDYLLGVASVLGTPRRSGGGRLGSIRLVTDSGTVT